MSGVDGVVALWERLMEGVGLGAVALASVRLETKFTFKKHTHYIFNQIYDNPLHIKCDDRKATELKTIRN